MSPATKRLWHFEVWVDFESDTEKEKSRQVAQLGQLLLISESPGVVL